MFVAAPVDDEGTPIGLGVIAQTYELAEAAMGICGMFGGGCKYRIFKTRSDRFEAVENSELERKVIQIATLDS
jgi:hypothetical protein